MEQNKTPLRSLGIHYNLISQRVPNSRKSRMIHLQQFCLEGMKVQNLSSKSTTCDHRDTALSNNKLSINLFQPRRLSLKTEMTEGKYFKFPTKQQKIGQNQATKKPAIFNLQFSTISKSAQTRYSLTDQKLRTENLQQKRLSVDEILKDKKYTIQLVNKQDVKSERKNMIEMNVFRYQKLQYSPKMKCRKGHFI